MQNEATDKPMTADEFVNAMREIHPNNMFYAPSTKKEMDAWLDTQKLDAYQMTVFMVGMNCVIQQMRNALPPEEFVFWFETDEGINEGSIFAKDLAEAFDAIKAEYPDDVGADGEFTNEAGETFPIGW